MNDNTDETFTRTSPPLNRFTVKLGGGPAPWDVLTAAEARALAKCYKSTLINWDYNLLLRYADAVDAMTHPECDMYIEVEDLGY